MSLCDVVVCDVRVVCHAGAFKSAVPRPQEHINMNQLNLIGNLGKDPEIVSKDKSEFANFSICVNHSDAKGKHADWFNVSVSNQHTVGFVKEHLKQGDMVFVSGQLKVEEYTSTKGEKKTSVKCIVGFDGQVRKLHSADPEAREKRARGGQ